MIDVPTLREVSIADAGGAATIEVDGHRLALTHLRKVLYPGHRHHEVGRHRATSPRSRTR